MSCFHSNEFLFFSDKVKQECRPNHASIPLGYVTFPSNKYISLYRPVSLKLEDNCQKKITHHRKVFDVASYLN